MGDRTSSRLVMDYSMLIHILKIKTLIAYHLSTYLEPQDQSGNPLLEQI